ncbi:MAG: rRNA pseudouridine synthase [Chromatiales bacterium]|nr:rRNA pseudouridine synthase [Chromatiales bacterium]
MLSKQGIASRAEAARWVCDGRVAVNGVVVNDPEFPVRQGIDHIAVDGREPSTAERVVILLNKPRGLVTTARDERGRDTVYRCLEGAGLPWLAPVGRLDQASEGLLLFTNDPGLATRITDPATGPTKTYHVQVDRIPDAALLAALAGGAEVEGERLPVVSVRLLRSGRRNAWLEVVLDEGRNRHLRRLLGAFGIGVLRLVRVAIGDLALGSLPKGQWRHLSDDELKQLIQP